MPTLPRGAGATTMLVLTGVLGYWAPMTLHPVPVSANLTTGATTSPKDTQASDGPARGTSGTGGADGPVDGRARARDSAVLAPAPVVVDALVGFPGLGPSTTERIPASSRQVLVVRGTGGSHATAILYVAGPAGWAAAGTWPARIGRNGWVAADRRRDGDLRTPAGVFTLTDAGGRSAPPAGTALPYTRSGAFLPTGRGVDGDSLTGVFDHVVAIDYNRVRGRSPLDPARPDGPAHGGGIWLHVDHAGPTRGCVGLPRDAMADLLRALAPSAHPVVVMGRAEDLDL